MKFAPALPAFLLLLVACASEPSDDQDLRAVQQKVSQCEGLLAKAAYRDAGDAAAEIIEREQAKLAVNDVAVDRLRFCFATARTLQQVQNLSAEIRRIVTILDSSLRGEGEAAAPYRKAAVQPFDTFLENLVQPMVELLESNRTQLSAIVDKGRFRWKIDRLPVTIAGDELFDARGVYDLGEVHVLLSMTELLLANFRMFQSNNYTIDLGPVVAYVMLEDSPLKEFEEKPAAAIVNLAAVLLATHPKFLGLKDGTGPALVAQAGQELASSASHLLAALDHMTVKRPGDQSKNIFEYRKDGIDDYLIVHIKFQREIVPGLELKKFDDLTISLRSEVVAGLKNIEASLAAAGGVRADLHTDIFPLISLVGVVLLNSGALDELVAETLESLDESVAEQLRAAFELGEMQESYLLAQLMTAVPVRAEVDLGQFFANPVSLRDLLPAWHQPSTPPAANSSSMMAFTEVTFVYEYECADPLAKPGKRLVCDDPVDGPHFATPLINNTTYDNLGPYWSGSIVADGIENPFAYIAFRDPTFNGALYLDVTNLNSAALDNEKGMKQANQRTLNAAIAGTAKVLYELFEK